MSDPEVPVRWVLVERGPNRGERLAVDAARARIGRGKNCEVRLADGNCSREHCAIEYVVDELSSVGSASWLVDLESKNGTWLNGERVRRVRLSVGDRIRLGQTTLIYVERAGGDGAAGESEQTETVESVELFQLPLRRIALGDPLDAEPATAVLPSAPSSGGMVAVVDEVGRWAIRSTDPDWLIEQTLAALVRETAAARAGLALLEPDGRALRPPVTWPDGAALSPTTAIVDAALNRREAVLVARKRRRLLAAPLWRTGAVAGVLMLELPGEGPVDHGLLLSLGALGGLLGGALDRVAQAPGEDAPALVGESEAMVRVRALVERVATSQATVLVTGESGTGKELVARAIHARSPRAGGPLVVLDAAALPLELVESELFGHEQGAFTGAVERRAGLFERASGGTLLLDEVAELDPRVQAKLLRVLEDGSFSRVGGSDRMLADVRVVAATRKDLGREVEAGRFRQDLYYRLRVLEIALPPLRERPDDLPALVTHLLARLASEQGSLRTPPEPTEAALDRLSKHAWPGNVRELRNVLQRALLMADGEALDVDQLGALSAAARGDTGPMTLRELESLHIRRLLSQTGGNKAKTARMLGIDRSTLYQKLRAMEADE